MSTFRHIKCNVYGVYLLNFFLPRDALQNAVNGPSVCDLYILAYPDHSFDLKKTITRKCSLWSSLLPGGKGASIGSKGMIPNAQSGIGVE